MQTVLAYLLNITCNTAVIQRKLISEFITSIKMILVLTTTDPTSERSFSMLRLINHKSKSLKAVNVANYMQTEVNLFELAKFVQYFIN